MLLNPHIIEHVRFVYLMFEASCDSSVVCELRHISGDIAQYRIYSVCVCVYL